MLSGGFRLRQPPLARVFLRKGCFQDLNRGIQFRLRIVTMRTEAEVIAPFPVMTQGGDNLGFFQRGEELGAAGALVAEGGDAARGRASDAPAEDTKAQFLEARDQVGL